MYFLKTALKRMTGRPWTSLFLILSIAFVLAVSSTLVNISFHLEKYTESTGNVYPVSAFIKPQVSRKQIEKIRRAIEQVPGVASVEFVPRSKFKKQFSDSYPNLKDSVGRADENMIPRYFRIKGSNQPRIVRLVSALQSIEYADFDKSGLHKLQKTIGISAMITKVIGLGLALILVLTLSNHLKVTLHTHADEIMTLTLMGASRMFLLVPLMIEAILYGVLGGAIGWLLRYAWEIQSLPTIQAFMKAIGYGGYTTNYVINAIYFIVSGIVICMIASILVQPKAPRRRECL